MSESGLYHPRYRSRFRIGGNGAERGEQFSSHAGGIATEIGGCDGSAAKHIVGDMRFEGAGVAVERDEIAIPDSCERAAGQALR